MYNSFIRKWLQTRLFDTFMLDLIILCTRGWWEVPRGIGWFCFLHHPQPARELSLQDPGVLHGGQQGRKRCPGHSTYLWVLRGPGSREKSWVSGKCTVIYVSLNRLCVNATSVLLKILCSQCLKPMLHRYHQMLCFLLPLLQTPLVAHYLWPFPHSVLYFITEKLQFEQKQKKKLEFIHISCVLCGLLVLLSPSVQITDLATKCFAISQVDTSSFTCINTSMDLVLKVPMSSYRNAS